MELGYLNQIEQATRFGRPELFRVGTGLLFIVGILIFSGTTVGGVPGGHLLVAAAMIGGYMAPTMSPTTWGRQWAPRPSPCSARS